jgi:hypothetical protein
MYVYVFKNTLCYLFLYISTSICWYGAKFLYSLSVLSLSYIYCSIVIKYFPVVIILVVPSDLSFARSARHQLFF